MNDSIILLCMLTMIVASFIAGRNVERAYQRQQKRKEPVRRIPR